MQGLLMVLFMPCLVGCRDMCATLGYTTPELQALNISAIMPHPYSHLHAGFLKVGSTLVHSVHCFDCTVAHVII